MFRPLILLYNCFWRCPWIFLTPGWMAFPQKLQFVFKHFTTVFLPVLPTHFINCSEVFTIPSHFWSRSSCIPFRCIVRYRRNIFVLSEMYCNSFTSWKTYLVIQTWRTVKWFRYPCHDIGCYPCTRKPVFGVSNQLRLKPACSATETS